MMGKKSNFIYETLAYFKWSLLIQTLLSFSWPIYIVLQPYLLRDILDKILLATPDMAWQAARMPFLIYITYELVNMLTFRFNDFLGTRFDVNVRGFLTLKILDRMMLHGHQLYQDHLVGALSSQVQYVTSYFSQIVRDTIRIFLAAFFAILITSVIFWYIHPGLTFFLLTWAISYFAVLLISYRHVNHLGKVAASSQYQSTGNMVDVFRNILSVKIFGHELLEESKQHTYWEDFVIKSQKFAWAKLFASFLQIFTSLLYFGGSLCMLIYGYRDGIISQSMIFMVFSINMKLFHIIYISSERLHILVNHVSGISKGLDIILSPKFIKDIEGATDLQVKRGDIVFDKVKFHYLSLDTLLFEELSIHIPGGQKVGLVGYSGSGKSTFAHLILRIFDIQKGEITIDGENISSVTQDSLRQSIGLIPQVPTLFRRSISENLRYARDHISDVQMIEAAKLAYVHDFVMRLPNQYDTIVGAGGAKLSGGQRQRMVIAQAFLQDAPILIMDESTAQLDAITEANVEKSLLTLVKNKTTLVIAHRLSTLRWVDRILVFDKGRIVQDGPHEVLVEQPGCYQELWKNQVGGFLPE